MRSRPSDLMPKGRPDRRGVGWAEFGVNSVETLREIAITRCGDDLLVSFATLIHRIRMHIRACILELLYRHATRFCVQEVHAYRHARRSGMYRLSSVRNMVC